MQTAVKPAGKKQTTLLRLVLALPILYIALLAGQPAGLDIPRIIQTIANDPGILVQQLINGLANGAIIAIIALGYTLVYGIIELVNFANSEVFMLGTLTSLIALSPFILLDPSGGQSVPWWAALLAFIPAMVVGALLNWSIERVAYRRLRNQPKLIVLISAIGMSFVLQNIGLQLGAFGKLTQAGPQFSFLQVLGSNNAAPKSFPRIFNDDNLLDYVFPPPPEETPAPRPAVQPSTNVSGTVVPGATQVPVEPSVNEKPEDVQAAVQATMDAQMNEQATADAQVTPEAEGTDAADATDTAAITDTAVTSDTAATPAAAEATATVEPTVAPSETAPPDTPTAAPSPTVTAKGKAVATRTPAKGKPTATPKVKVTATSAKSKASATPTPEPPTATAEPTQAESTPTLEPVATTEPVSGTVGTTDAALPTEEPTATLDPTDAAEATVIIATVNAQDTAAAATSIAEGTPAEPTVVVDASGATATDEPTPDLIQTMQAENGGTPIVPLDANQGNPPASPDGGTPGADATDGAAAVDNAPQVQTKTRLRITFKDVLVIAVALFLMIVLNWFINKTKMGKAMRATAQNRSAAQIMGINIDQVIGLTFVIAGALAGAAGMMTGIYNGTFVFNMGFTAGLRSFTAAVLGGIGNITGAALGGILIGLLAAFSDQFFSVRWTNAWVFLILVLVLLFKPTGLLGSEGGEKA